MATFEYRPETLRLRNSFLLMSGLLFSIAFVSNTFLGFLRITATSSDTNNELAKIAAVIFLIGTYKATYYYFRLKNDTQQSHRSFFSGREKDLDGEMRGDLAMTTDIVHDPSKFNAIEEMSEKIGYINSTLEQLTSLPLDNLEDARKASRAGRQPSDILTQAKGYMQNLDKRYKKYKQFYKSEAALEKSMRIIFMWGVPYVTFILAIIISFPYLYDGIAQMGEFICQRLTH